MLSISCRNTKTSIYRIWILLALLFPGCNDSTAGLPFDPHIEGLELVNSVTGADAMKAINKLHGMPINVVRGFVANYKGTHDKATVWVSEASSQKLAKQQITLMFHKMKNNRRLPFSDYRTLNTNGVRVIAFDGMGQVHYVFRDSKWLYWISADRERIDSILKHLQRTG